MAKVKTVKFDVAFTVTVPEEAGLKAKDVKRAVENEVGYVADNIEGAKVGKIAVAVSE